MRKNFGEHDLEKRLLKAFEENAFEDVLLESRKLGLLVYRRIRRIVGPSGCAPSHRLGPPCRIVSSAWRFFGSRITADDARTFVILNMLNFVVEDVRMLYSFSVAGRKNQPDQQEKIEMLSQLLIHMEKAMAAAAEKIGESKYKDVALKAMAKIRTDIESTLQEGKTKK